ncbi:MAG TPA: UvrD-helicase domain-containing protein [Miltoncostaeaceae bacterium]|nr:UvrD-helicase domain-containing protein [Miltoncostaeaceae bacterium]
MSELVDGLNEPQRAAVLHGGGPLLVLAGAGSGKTRVLTRRVAHLIAQGVPPYAILAITFTNRAASEMRERIAALVGPNARDIWASTFHSTCVRILRREAPAAGYPRDFSIFDADDQLRLIRRCLVEEDLDPKQHPPRAIQARISEAKSRLQDAEAFAAEADRYPDEIAARVYRRYEDQLRANGALDFDDLLMVTARLLERDPAVRARWQGRFRHVLVDEYQDTNHVQFRLVQLLAAPENNIVVVGDDDQSIYSWRGADVRNILEFQGDYPDAAAVTLDQNYRSTGLILKAAHAVVRRNSGRHAKELWTDLGPGEPIAVHACRDEYDEARTVAEAIEAALTRGVPPSQVAVFYRTNAQSRALEDILVRSGVGYAVIGGPRFYERAEVRDLLAYLRAAVNPADRVSLERALGAPRRGVGPAAVAKLADHAVECDIPIGLALERADAVPGLNARQRSAVAALGRLLGEVREQVAAGAPLGPLVERVLEGSGLREALEREDTFEARGRVENLEEVVGAAAQWPVGDLAGFLEQVALQADADQIDAASGTVTLMTIHNAKGLEFDTVIIAGLEEGLFPHARADSPEALEEERRLFYVGLTRARRSLTLTHATSRAIHGGRDYRLPSSFLGELPVACLAVPASGERVRPGESVTSPPARRAAARRSRVARTVYLSGDAVVHATFGRGVVTEVEGAGELVRVRFASDGVERRLMAAAAPMTKAGE